MVRCHTGFCRLALTSAALLYALCSCGGVLFAVTPHAYQHHPRVRPVRGGRAQGSIREACTASLAIAALAAGALIFKRPTRFQATARAASATDKILKLVDEFPENYDNDDMWDFKQDYKKLEKLDDAIVGYNESAFGYLNGSWKLEFNSTIGLPKKTQALSLRSLDGVLPDVQVNSIGKYLKISEGTYEIIHPFTIPDSNGEAALVFAGSWFGGKPVPAPGMSVPDRTRVTSEIKSLRITPAASDPEAPAVLEAAGLSKFASPVKIDRKPEFNDLEYASEKLFAQKSREGVVEVYTSSEVPFC